MAVESAGGRQAAGGRILFIDDDQAGREVALFNLRNAGHEVTPAADRQEGLTLFSASRFDLVVTDLKMPGISGLEVLGRVLAQAPDVPVLVITAFGNVETAVAAMKAGAEDFIGKPFHREQLLLAVERALERRRVAAEVRDLRIRASGKINQKIVAALAVKLTAREKTLVTQKGTSDPAAYEEFLKGREDYLRYTKEDFAQAEVCFERAIELDLNYSQAKASLALLYYDAAHHGGLTKLECP